MMHVDVTDEPRNVCKYDKDGKSNVYGCGLVLDFFVYVRVDAFWPWPQDHIHKNADFFLYIHIHTCNMFMHKSSRHHEWCQISHTCIHTHIHIYIHTYIHIDSPQHQWCRTPNMIHINTYIYTYIHTYRFPTAQMVSDSEHTASDTDRDINTASNSDGGLLLR